MFQERDYSISIVQPAEIYDPSKGQRPIGRPNVAYVRTLRGWNDFLPYALAYRYLGGAGAGACCKGCAQGRGCAKNCGRGCGCKGKCGCGSGCGCGKPQKKPCCKSCGEGNACESKKNVSLGACCDSCAHGGPCSGGLGFMNPPGVKGVAALGVAGIAAYYLWKNLK